MSEGKPIPIRAWFAKYIIAIKIILEDDEKTITRLEKQVSRLQGYVGVLVAALRAAGIPVPVSDEMDTETSG